MPQQQQILSRRYEALRKNSSPQLLSKAPPSSAVSVGGSGHTRQEYDCVRARACVCVCVCVCVFVCGERESEVLVELVWADWWHLAQRAERIV